jgi:type IV pilus assembly protein PilB
MAPKLGQLLVSKKIITEDQLIKAVDLQKREGGRIGSNLIKLGFVTEEALIQFLSNQYGVPSVSLANLEVDSAIIKFVPYDVANKYQIFPISKNGATLKLAMTDPSNVFAIDDVKFMTNYEVEPVVASEADIKEAIARHYEQSEALEDVIGKIDGLDDTGLDLIQEAEDDTDISELKGAGEEAPVVKLVNLILSEAIMRGASDIHIEPYEKEFRIRYRVDGVLHDVMQPPKRLKAALSSRLKIMSELDIAERRLPQDGRIKLKIKDKGIDLRVSTLPTLFGEKIVMRILDKSNLNLDMTKLGFEEQALKDFEEAITSPFGMVLVTGPTGSGKTTTLYSALSTVNKIDVNIMTAEDPVEYNLMGINQVHVRDEIGLSFAAALRSFLRQDPDIVMVGEIRDFETAEIAVKAALTGHLVLSTLHTNDAPSTVSRMLNMGVEPFLVSASVVLILAQRLCRKICEQCKEEEEFPDDALLNIGFKQEELNTFKCYKGKGCPACGESGYKGRIALYEVMPMKEELKDLVIKGGTSTDLKRAELKFGMAKIRMSGLFKDQQRGFGTGI